MLGKDFHMSITYRIIKKSWRAIAPASFSAFAFGGHSTFSKAMLTLKARLESRADHNEIYDKAYYLKYSDEVARSAIGIVKTIMAHLSPKSIVDIGCGSGEIIRRFGEFGVKSIGLDYSDAALAICRERNLECLKCDLESNTPIATSLSADLVLSTEVAEHLPDAWADRYVDFICQIANRAVVITAATPGQGGTDHVNEQPFSYWIKKFERRGVNYSEEKTLAFRREWAAQDVEESRARNVMVFYTAT